jgi:tetratricopeptide (TPR) repeat protein
MRYETRVRTALLLAALAVPRLAPAQSPVVDAVAAPAAPATRSVTRLDVPFVPQSPALCGGAAVAMVLRYWGERGIYASEFAHLVVPTGEGIRTLDLLGAVRERGWQAEAFAGDRDLVRDQLSRGRPVIVLMEVRTGRYHYVVITEWSAGVVRMHDPALGPSRAMDEAAFQRAWRAAESWTMLVLPTPAPATTDPAAAAPAVTATLSHATAADPSDACTALIAEAARTARGGAYADAERTLDQAGALCADVALPLLERAGIRFRQARYAEAADLARLALVTRPDDLYGWELLASSSFLLNEFDAALDAWNRAGKPRNDLTRIDGLRRTRYLVVHDAIGIEPGTVVTAAALARARRRTAALPSIGRSRVDYRPVRGGDVEVQVAVAEKPLLPRSRFDIAALTLGALADRRLEVHAASPFGAGELWHAAWSWPANRRATEISLIAPGAFGVPGIWTVRAGEQTHTFRASATDGADDALLREVRRGASLGFSDWAHAGVHWGVAASLDEWIDRGRFGGITVHLDRRDRHDRTAARIAVEGWTATQSQPFHRLRLDAAVRSHPANTRVAWQLRTGIIAASATAPRDLWPGAGTGRASDVLLRAHPLLNADHVVTGAFTAPRLLHAGAEATRRIFDTGPLRLSVAGFIDAAAVQRHPADAARSAIDAGAGIRLHLPGMPGAFRADAARSLTDGARALSIGWSRSWPD